MLKKSLLALLCIASMGWQGPAEAGVYSDDLTRCLVKSAAPADQTNLMRWIFSAIALHPDVSSLSNISQQQRADIDKTAGKLFMRLLTSDCRTETVAALKYEGASSLEGSFNTLGQIASKGLFAAPEVMTGIAGLTANIDEAEIGKLYTDAGLPAPK